MNNILIFGANGQLGQSLKKVVSQTDVKSNYLFLKEEEADILNIDALKSLFDKHQPTYVINCAAYTAVDSAEENKDTALAINCEGVQNLADFCQEHNCCLIHISTDFVFEGVKSSPLTEDDIAKPINVYGETKLKGEEAIASSGCNYFILRTSWLYSEFGNNFLKTMLRLAETKTSLNVVGDQVGTPTYAVDLAELIVFIIENEKIDKELFHFSNEGVASWYDFAHEIFAISNVSIDLNSISTAEFPTLAKRPAYSVLNKSKLKNSFNYYIPHWRDSLSDCITSLNKIK